MEQVKNVNYQELDFGTKSGTPIRQDLIEVKIGVSVMGKNYTAAMINHVCNVCPAIQERVNLTQEELDNYLLYLIQQRCDQCNGKCENWGRLKALYIPSYAQFVLSQIGVFVDRKYAIKVVPIPEVESSISYSQAVQISERLSEFEDYLHMSNAAMPPQLEGDPVVMSSAIIADKVRSMSREMSPAMQYVVAFANMSLAKENAFAALYRTQYDDIETIQLQVTSRALV